ncbi:MAG: alpha/beta fold hydrolase [Burkholderiales bacterium]|nr:alpha/beta fold hydrolase [Burkholderiales bacterium]
MKTKVNGINVHYEIAGEGPWVTMAHSLAWDSRMWDDFMDALTAKFKVLRYDTRGHGGTDLTPGPYTLDLLADDAHALLEALGIRRTHWVGLSMGGMIGQTFAVKYPGVCQSMVLADTTSRFPAEAGPQWLNRIKLAETEGMNAIAEHLLGRWFTEPFRKANPELMRQIGDAIRATPVEGFTSCAHAVRQIDLTGRLQEIDCPALIMVGEHDPGTTPEQARALHAAKPNSELVVIPSAAHMSSAEQPQVFREHMLGFLSRVS